MHGRRKNMKKRIISIFLAASVILQSSLSVNAYKKNLSAFTKEQIPCYSDSYGSDRIGTISRYTGMDVKDEAGSYYLVEYKKNGKTRTGWVAKEDVKDSCLEYDGSEIPLTAPGTYLLGGQKVKIIFLGNNQYKIQLKATKEYFTGSYNGSTPLFTLSGEKEEKSQIWQMKRVNDQLMIQSKNNHQYLIQSGQVIRMGTYKEAVKQNWLLTRVGTNVDPYYNICQYDGRWGKKKYGSSTTMAEAACGVLVVVNAVYALNGQLIDPMDGAAYACETGYRVPYSGTDEGFLIAAAKGLGDQYGFCYSGAANTISDIKTCIQNGGVVLAHVPGHYVAIVDYNEKSEKYLVLDSHPLEKRATSPFGTWVNWKRLTEGSLNAYSNFMYEKVTDTRFQWEYEKQELGELQSVLTNLNPNEEEIVINERNKNGKVE